MKNDCKIKIIIAALSAALCVTSCAPVPSDNGHGEEASANEQASEIMQETVSSAVDFEHELDSYVPKKEKNLHSLMNLMEML